MLKTNLPVIVLRGIVLLPNNEIRLEFDNDNSKNIIDVAELFHDNRILVVTKKDALEENLEIEKLPKNGVIAKISHKLELPNGKTRVIITGIKRAVIHEYLNINKQEDMLESIASKLPKLEIESKEEEILIKKLYREVEKFIDIVPYASNSILTSINDINDLDKMTDIVVSYLQLDIEKRIEYLNNNNSIERLEMILSDLYQEEEMFKIEKEIDSKVRKTLDESQREYLLKEKIKTIKQELGESSVKEDEVDILREKIETIDVPDKVRERLFSELRRYESLSQLSPEVNIVRNYIDWLLDLPWNIETIDNDDLTKAKEILDSTHNGLEKIKMRIIEYLAVKQMKGNLRSPIICLVGPPGVGKTSLAYSMAEAMNRNFVKISVGGINDEAELIGHRRTYLGSSPGRIISGLKKAKSKNPLFLIDEIDKMTRDYKGDPASVLLEILDTEQNKYFSDNYIEEEFDLSKVVFITTANYLENIPDALRDRLEIIKLSGYTEYDKLEIAKKHLIPKICKEHGVNSDGIIFKDEAILKIIRNYTRESGVRELERQLATVIRKIVTQIVINKVIVNKYIIDSKKVKTFLEKEKYHFNRNDKLNEPGIVNGLAYTYFGGDVLPIETEYFEGNGNLVLTGSLGDVMKESSKIALDYIKANAKTFKIDFKKFTNNDIHIHFPEGAVQKDGPSAGIAITTSLISLLTNKKVSNDIALTGEITLHGNVLAIGGLKEKVIGAHRNGIKKIFIPADNKIDLDDIPDNIKNDIEFICVKNYKEIFNQILKNDKRDE